MCDWTGFWNRLLLSLSLVPKLRPDHPGAFFGRRGWVQSAMTYTDQFLKDILNDVKEVACVGVSMNPVRPSYFVARYLGLKGYKVTPVNPGHAGKLLFGQPICASLADVPHKDRIEMVDVFRRSEAVPALVDEALEHLPNLKVIWLQIGVEHAEAAAKAEARGIRVVQNRCPKIEYQRLFGELRMGGFRTGVISSKL
jgi:predicted CoA-binding protein